MLAFSLLLIRKNVAVRAKVADELKKVADELKKVADRVKKVTDEDEVRKLQIRNVTVVYTKEKWQLE